ncbi:hypothetical protein BP5796_05153 [Coleophoma crateriformis]|uniref:SUN domain-containing protein n=1 Tax=Coleophoma crateriformis TaxID=565419 RepID=A0A3D8S2F1_9HELO|nr:hypothetical protein BP5796_05153 [Coleophoma crateriformis]
MPTTRSASARSASLQPLDTTFIDSRATNQRSKRFTSLPPEDFEQRSLPPRQASVPAAPRQATSGLKYSMSEITSSTHMGVKRVTRSQSRSGATPVPRVTPARGLRGRNGTPGGLNPVGRESKAYGTGPATLARPFLSGQGEDDVAAIMHGIAFGEQTPGSDLGSLVSNSMASSIAESETPSKAAKGHKGRADRSRAESRQRDSSFAAETSVFNQAGVETSSMEPEQQLQPIEEDLEDLEEEEEDDDIAKPIPKYPRYLDQEEDDEEEEEEEEEFDLQANNAYARNSYAGRNRDGSRRTETPVLGNGHFGTFLTYLTENIMGNLVRIAQFLGLALLLYLLWSIAGLPQIRNYGFDLSHNIGQFIPTPLVRPITYLRSDAQTRSIMDELRTLHYDVQYMQRTHGLRADTAEFLRNIDKKWWDSTEAKYKDSKELPEIPLEFLDKVKDHFESDTAYYALRNRLRDDPAFIPEPWLDLRNSTGDIDASRFRQLASKMDKTVGEIRSTVQEENALAMDYAKSKILKSMNQEWKEMQKSMQPELDQMQRKVEDALQRVIRLEQGFTKEYRDLVSTKIDQFMHKFKLEKQTEKQLASSRRAPLRINYFSQGHGADIIPHMTSPKYTLQQKRVSGWAISRWVWTSTFGRPVPAGHEAYKALEKWDEYGEAWCTPSGGAKGFGASLHVRLGYPIFVEEIVIEHIAESGTLEPGSTPKDIEIYARYPPNTKAMLAVQQSTEHFFKQAAEQEFPYDFVLIAESTFKIGATESQAVKVPVDLKAVSEKYGVDTSTREIIVRVKNNWSDGRVPYTCLYRVLAHGQQKA